MSKVFLETKTAVHLFLLNFENINMIQKGNYRVKIEAHVEKEQCSVQSLSQSGHSSELGKQDNQQYLSQEFTVKFQNEKVELMELLCIESPSLKDCQDKTINIKFTLLKAEKCCKESFFTKYLPLRSSQLIIRFFNSTSCQYCQCSFQEPLLSTLSALILVQPSCLSLNSSLLKKRDSSIMLKLKKQVKKMRWNSYLLHNKFKKIFYSPLKLDFTLPKIFVTHEESMDEVVTNEQKFLEYLALYEQTKLTIEMINYELLSICYRNDELFKIFDDNCLKKTILTTKLKLDFEEKERKRHKMYVVNEQYKEKYFDEYKTVLKQKLKALHDELDINYQDEVLNNICFKIESCFEDYKPYDLPNYPIIIHESLKLSKEQSPEKQKRKIRYILILAHGYQGSPDDLAMLANGFKKQYKKTKYLILKAYKNKMGESLSTMANLSVQQINCFLNCIEFKKDKIYRIVMIGHSMGGLVLRLASNRINHQDLLYGYVSLGTPHLGYLQGLKLYIRAGLSFFSNIYSNPCLDQISGKDEDQLHQTAIFKMSESGSLANFKKIVLVASSKDKYVSWHSARLQNMNRDFLKHYTFIEKEMIDNILPQKGIIQQIERLEVDFNCAQSNMDRLIGRTSHIKMLTDCCFIELLCENCIPRVFDHDL